MTGPNQISGVGVDLAEIDRFKKILKLPQKRKTFLNRIATEDEQTFALQKNFNFNRLCEFWAGHFAAKEALSKAIGSGIGKNFSFLSCSICYDKKGKPGFKFSNPRFLKIKKIKKAHLSISHTSTLAIAFVILER